MGIIGLSSAFVGLAFFSSGQSTTFYRSYNLPGMQGGLATLNMPDGGFVGTGQHEGNGSAGDCDIYVYRVDECGQIQWMKLIGTGAQEGAKHIAQRQNGNMLLTGLYNGKSFMLELDPDGNLIWEKAYAGEFSLSSAEDAGGNIYMTERSPSGYLLTKCDPVGNPIWSKEVTGAGRILATVLVVGEYIYITSTDQLAGHDFALAKFDPQGNLAWCNLYAGAGYPDLDHSHFGSKAIFDPADSTIMVTNQTILPGTEDLLLCKIDPADGHVRWAYAYGGPGSDQPRDIAITSRGYALLGNSDSYPASSGPGLSEPMGERDVLLLSLDQNGNVLWARTYGGAERDRGIGLRYSPANGFLISAFTSSPFFGNRDASMDPLFIRTDSLGFVSCQTHSPTVNQTSVILTTSSITSSQPVGTSSSGLQSTISDYSPNDTYFCFNCITIPRFVASDTVICAGDSVTFQNTTSVGPICFQAWNVAGNIFNGSDHTVTHTFHDAGIYRVLLYSNCGGQTDTFSVHITVHPNPKADFQAAETCAGGITSFENLSSISTGTISAYSWDFGDGHLSADRNPLHRYPVAGVFEVSLSATSDQGCAGDTAISLRIYPNPEARIRPDSACAGSPVILEDSSRIADAPISSWQWQPYPAAPWEAAGPNFLTAYATAGTYIAALIVTDTIGCRDTAFAQVIIFPNPVAAFTVNPVCPGVPSAFENQTEIIPAAALSYSWNFGDTNTSWQAQPAHTFATSGRYPVTLVATSSFGCRDSASTAAIVYPDPVPLVRTVPAGCAPYRVSFVDSSYSASAAIVTWHWDFQNGMTSELQQPSLTYPISGNYPIALAVMDQNGCKADSIFEDFIVVHPVPTADFFFDPALPEAFLPTRFTNTSAGAIAFAWDFGDGDSAAEENPTHVFDSTGRYSVQLIAENVFGCVDTLRKAIQILDDFSLWVPNVFSPNGDGINDVFLIPIADRAITRIEYLRIFDRWGNHIFQVTDVLPDDPSAAWDGTFRGQALQPAVFAVQLAVRYTDGRRATYQGDVTLVK